MIKSLLDLANAILQVLNTPIGEALTQATLLTGVLWGGTGLIKAMKIIPALFGKMAAGVTIFGKAISITVPQLALIAGIITALIHFGPKIVDWIHRQTDEVYDAEQKLATLNEQLGENQSRLDELNKIPYANRTQEIQKEIDALKEENEILRSNIELQEGRKAFAGFKETAEGKHSAKAYSVSSSSKSMLGYQGYVDSAKEAIDKLVEFGYATREQVKQLFAETQGDAEKVLQKLGYTLESQVIELSGQDFYNKTLNDYKNLVEQLNRPGAIFKPENVTALEDAKLALKELFESASAFSDEDLIKSGLEWVVDLRKQFAKIPDISDKVADSYYNVVESLWALKDGMAINEMQYQQLLRMYPELEGHLTKTELGYEDLEGATANYAKENEYLEESLESLTTPVHRLLGGLEVTEEQIKELIGLYPELTEVIQQHAGAYYLDIQALADSADAGSEWARSFIASQSAATEETLKQVKTRINALRYELIAARAAGQDKATKDRLQQQLNELEAQRDALNRLNAYADYSGVGGSISGGSGSSSQKETDALAEQNKLFKEQIAIMEHKLFLMQKNGASEEEQIEHIKKMQELVHEQAEWFREHGVSEDSEYIRELQKQWWKYEEQIGNIYKEEAGLYEMLFSVVAEKAQAEIDILEKKKAEIQEQNEALEEQIALEEALDALARAKQQKVLVYKDGRMQYVTDEDAVSAAQKTVNDIKKKQAMDKELEEIDKEIEKWQEYKDEWSSVVSDYQKQQDLLLLEQKLGIKLEGENWEKRLGNLADYVKKYNELMAQAGQHSGADNPTASGGHYASGTTHARGGFSLVGETGPELRVLNRGDGILPASITDNLWKWGSMSPSDLVSGITNLGQTIGIHIENFNPVLPNVSDGEGFAQYMKNNFWRKVMQTGMA